MYVNDEETLAKALQEIEQNERDWGNIPLQERVQSLATPGAVSNPETEEFLRKLAEYLEQCKKVVLDYEICDQPPCNLPAVFL